VVEYFDGEQLYASKMTNANHARTNDLFMIVNLNDNANVSKNLANPKIQIAGQFEI
jgi:hypothetical protein